MNASSAVLSLLRLARSAHQLRRKVRVLVHRAYFLTPGLPQEEHFFIKVTNLSPKREIEVTHIWFDTRPTVDILNDARPLPTRVGLDETFETWIPVQGLPPSPDNEWLCRVELSSGRTIKSRLNTTVRPSGYVAGPGSPTNA